MAISSAQCRAARALLDWSQDQLSENAQVARATIADFERNTRMPMRQNLLSIRSALEAAGVAFLSDGGEDEGAGVRFRKVRIEYSRTLRQEGYDFILSVRYKGTPYSVVLPRAVIDDLDRASSRSDGDRRKALGDHLPKFLLAAEGKIARGAVSERFELTHNDFPMGTF